MPDRERKSSRAQGEEERSRRRRTGEATKHHIPDSSTRAVSGKVVLEEHFAEVGAASENAGTVHTAVVILGLHQHKVGQLLHNATQPHL